MWQNSRLFLAQPTVFDKPECPHVSLFPWACNHRAPTAPDAPYGFAVSYVVTDGAGLSAPTAWRLIRVVCPAGQRYCVDTDGQAQCTVAGVCGLAAEGAELFGGGDGTDVSVSVDSNGGVADGSSNGQMTLGPTPLALGSPLGGSSTGESSNNTIEVENEFEPTTNADAPRIALRGPRTVSILQLGSYDRWASGCRAQT